MSLWDVLFSHLTCRRRHFVPCLPTSKNRKGSTGWAQCVEWSGGQIRVQRIDTWLRETERCMVGTKTWQYKYKENCKNDKNPWHFLDFLQIAILQRPLSLPVDNLSVSRLSWKNSAMENFELLFLWTPFPKWSLHIIMIFVFNIPPCVNVGLYKRQILQLVEIMK